MLEQREKGDDDDDDGDGRNDAFARADVEGVSFRWSWCYFDC